MITKERLEELIEQGATIFIITRQSFIAGVSNFIDIQRENLSKENNIGKDNTLYWKDIGIAELEYLFETKEDARWELEMTATRTETLKLPNWKEFNKKYKKKMSPTIAFIGKNPQCFYELFYKDKNIYIFDCDCAEYLYSKPLSKENYIEACKLCRKLFLGEEV